MPNRLVNTKINITEHMRKVFWEHVTIDPGGCWEWKNKYVDRPDSYGSIYIGNHKNIVAHRFSYILHHGEVPEGLVVCHRCMNKRCVNPSHLYVGTDYENRQDEKRAGLTKKRQSGDCKISRKTN